jgi:hypothetical protein
MMSWCCAYYCYMWRKFIHASGNIMYSDAVPLMTNWLTHSLTSWSRVLLEKLIITQIVKTFTAFCGTWRFITILTTAHHWSLFWARWIQPTPSHLISLRSILMLCSHSCLGLLSGTVMTEKFLNTYLIHNTIRPALVIFNYWSVITSSTHKLLFRV